MIRAGVGDALEWRTLIVLEDGAEAEVWEEWVSGDDETEGLFNGVTEIVVGEGATLHYVGAQSLNDSTWVFANQRAVVARDATLDWSALAFGSARGKVWMETKLDGQGSTARVTGAYVPDGRQHLDFDTLQEHAAPNTVSDLAFRGVLGGRSSAVWRGMIAVDRGAQKTDAFQECRNLLLSKKAHADAIPGPRDPGGRRALHARGGDRPARQGAALLPQGARTAEVRVAAPDHRRLPAGARRAPRGGEDPRHRGGRAGTPPGRTARPKEAYG